MESKILKTIITSRESFNALAPYINNGEQFSEVGKVLYSTIEDFYQRDPEMGAVDQDILLKFIENKYPNKIDLFAHLVDNMPESVSAPNILEYYRELKRENLGDRIASSLLGSQDKKAVALMEDYLSLSVEAYTEETTLCNLDAEELLEKTHGTDLIPMYPKIISDKLGGGMPRQGQMLIYARPDIGKSTVAMNIAGGATKDGFKVLNCGNEDPTSVMVRRYLARATGWTQREVGDDLQGAIDAAREAGGYQNYIFHPMAPGSMPEIRAQIEKHSPDIVIIDQIRSVITGAEGHTLSMERVCIEMRALAKEHNFVSILVTQAGESANNKLVLDMVDVEWSNTGIQGAMDLMVGVGQNQEWKDKSRIMLSFPKNKLTEPIKPFDCRIDYACQKILGKRE